MSEQEKVENTPLTEVSEDLTESPKKAKSDKKGKAKEREAQKEQSRLKKEWEDSLVASKRVKREEMRRKLKRAMLIMLVFALIVTSLVYVMLLFVQENNVRIYASSSSSDKSISLSVDNEHWTPYLNTKGPDRMWDVSYDKGYGREELMTVEEAMAMLSGEDVKLGVLNGEHYICFTFMLKNTCDSDVNLNYQMSLEFDQYELPSAIRVMWGESFKKADGNSHDNVSVYAQLSKNEKLYGTDINYRADGTPRTVEDGFIEYVAYPTETARVDNGAQLVYPTMKDFEVDYLADDYQKKEQAIKDGYFATTPFYSDNYVFQRSSILEEGDIMYCYVCIWLEGSDFDCNNERLGGWCKLGITFTAS